MSEEYFTIKADVTYPYVEFKGDPLHTIIIRLKEETGET